jgi:ubiquitin C-terminal hydrolase
MENISKIYLWIAILCSYQVLSSKNKGLEWGDNSCYFDASIQALSTLKDFNEDLKKHNPENTPPASTYLKLINLIKGKFTEQDQYLKRGDKIEGETELKDFHLGFSMELEPKNRPTGQKDAPEFITKILDGIREVVPELEKKFRDKLTQDLKELGLVGQDLDDSVRAGVNELHDPFEKISFNTVSTKICPECKNSFQRQEKNLSLILYFETDKPIEIEEFLKGNFKDASVDYLCACGKTVVSKAIKKIASLPKYLIIHLSRSLGNRKIKTSVKFGFNLYLNQIKDILTDDLKKELSEKPLKYSLTAFVVHSGETVNSGHYWAYAKSSEPADKDFWYLYNDAAVSDMGKEKDLKSDSQFVKVMESGLDNGATPYILFYELKELNLSEMLNELKTKLQELKTKLQALQDKLTELRGTLGE